MLLEVPNYVPSMHRCKNTKSSSTKLTPFWITLILFQVFFKFQFYFQDDKNIDQNTRNEIGANFNFQEEDDAILNLLFEKVNQYISFYCFNCFVEYLWKWKTDK